jgi:hypothetical protein
MFTSHGYYVPTTVLGAGGELDQVSESTEDFSNKLFEFSRRNIVK